MIGKVDSSSLKANWFFSVEFYLNSIYFKNRAFAKINEVSGVRIQKKEEYIET